MGGIDGCVGARVPVFPLREKLSDRDLALCDQRSVVPARDSAEGDPEVAVQMNGEGAPEDKVGARGLGEGTPTGGKNDSRSLEDVPDRLSLQLAEVTLPLGAEDLAHRGSRTGLDLGVAVDEVVPDSNGQPPPDRGLPGAHESDEGYPRGQVQSPAPRSSSPKKPGSEIETTSAPAMFVSPSAQSAATDRAMAIR